MEGAARARRAEAQVVGRPLAHIGQKLAHVGHRQAVGHRQHVLRRPDRAHRPQVLLRVERHALEERRIDGQRHGVDGEHVAVGLGARHGGHADVAGGAGAVLHDHALPQRPPPGIGNQARGDVHAAARRERHDERHRAFGKCAGGDGRLGPTGCDGKGRAQGAGGGVDLHSWSPRVAAIGGSLLASSVYRPIGFL
ncbi:hypothetical protein D9M68_722860 [compost metagenome]